VPDPTAEDMPCTSIPSSPRAFVCTPRFEELLSPDALRNTFLERFSSSPGKGIDRASGFQFGFSRIGDLVDASRKCLNGTFRFTPYLEVLRPKGRHSKPRLISIPTIRDRVILNQLKELLAEAFPECIPRSIAGAIVREIAADLPTREVASTYAAGCDIREFYDKLVHDRLMRHIATRMDDPRAVKLIERSILTPTVPAGTRRADYAVYRRTRGVPQGLATSNIMAAIYVSEIDEGMRKLPVKYFRYVDDVLMYGDEDAVLKAQKSFISRARRRGLPVHKVGGGKSHITRLSDEFRYLGYVFKGREITVRASTVENLLATLAAKFSSFRHNRKRQLERLKYLTQERQQHIFLSELNERITGAVRENRRYGWVAYFSQITDLSLLYKLDRMVEGLFRRIPEFNGTAPPELKSFVRAFFEMKYRPHGGYIRDFDAIASHAEMLRFLVDRGRVGPDENLTDPQIEDRFNRYTNALLSAMRADEANIY
jgi:RNA-directed DNA polymerase